MPAYPLKDRTKGINGARPTWYDELIIGYTPEQIKSAMSKLMVVRETWWSGKTKLTKANILVQAYGFMATHLQPLKIDTVYRTICYMINS
eukprot:COSAG01_NODE_67307_length_267_cov_0.928571_1_plen_89_part_11